MKVWVIIGMLWAADGSTDANFYANVENYETKQQCENWLRFTIYDVLQRGKQNEINYQTSPIVGLRLHCEYLDPTQGRPK